MESFLLHNVSLCILGLCRTSYCMPQSTFSVITNHFILFSDEELAKEKQKLYDAIGYQEDGPGTVYPKEVHVTPLAGSVDKTPVLT